MRTDTLPIPATAPGTASALTVHRFGQEGARPRAYIQAALHADEIPGMIAAHHLRERLTALEQEGRIAGEVVLVPFANPIGLGQCLLGQAVGRFDLSDGLNFNRAYPYLEPAVADRVAADLSDDADANVGLIRDALAAVLAEAPAATPAEHLKKLLLSLAVEADLVLDLHCDGEAVMHLYTLTPMAEDLAPLAALLGCEAVLLATESGDDPFDEACSRPWHELRERFPDRPIPLACLATTVELRGEADVDHALASKDAKAILDYLLLRGVIAGDPPAVPEPLCAPTPLAGTEPLTAPVPGMVVYLKPAGARVRAGERIADLIDPATGVVTPVTSRSDGVLFARAATRFATAGRRLGKVAGTAFHRSGKLLSP
ncbi:MAG TPA: succinylglutamate desuccinylase/aspartoacylase family protein [Beijerinckiaceae bacterium]|jgi:predicted deacylase